METDLDQDAAALHRAHRGLRLIRVHLYLIVMSLCGAVLVPVIFKGWALAAGALPPALAPLARFPPLDWVTLSLWSGFVMCGPVMAHGLNRCLAGLRGGGWRIGLGLLYVAAVVGSGFARLSPGPGLVVDTGTWPLQVLLVYYGALAAYLAVYAGGVQGLFALRHPAVRAHLRAGGYGAGLLRSLRLLCLGPLTQRATRLSPTSWAMAIAAFFLMGWGVYLLFGIPLGLMAGAAMPEARSVLAPRFFEINLLIVALKGLAGFALVLAGRQLLRRVRARAVPDIDAVRRRDPRGPILFLRPFRLDDPAVSGLRRSFWAAAFDLETGEHSIEEAVVHRFHRFGPVIAVARPAQRSPRPGAVRMRLDTTQAWQDQVLALMTSARLIVILVDSTKGVLWELDQLVALGLMHKVLVLFPVRAQQQAWDPAFAETLVHRLRLDQLDLDETAQADALAYHLDMDGAARLYTTTAATRAAYEAGLLHAGRALLAASAAPQHRSSDAPRPARAGAPSDHHP